MQVITDAVAAALLDGSPDGVIICDADGVIVLVNKQAEQLFGATRAELVGKAVEHLVPDQLRAAHINHRGDFNHNPHTRTMGESLQLWAKRVDGTTFPVEVALSPVLTNERALVIATVRDVSVRLGIQAELESARTKTLLAEDRERIARDLHDTVIQRLFADGLTLQAILPRVPEEVRGRLQEVIDDHDDAIREIRTSIFGLGRTRAGESGLRRAIIEVVDQSGRILGFRPTLRLDGVLEGSLNDAIEAEMLATMREGLSNTARHAGASAVEIDVGASDSVLRLVIADNGAGISAERLSAGNGIANMQARAIELGGSCTISARSGGGTVVEWVVPVG
ncbi:MAG: PAS domain-containing sensor histidine kinase [Acidimicrobiia bacterium]